MIAKFPFIREDCKFGKLTLILRQNCAIMSPVEAIVTCTAVLLCRHKSCLSCVWNTNIEICIDTGTITLITINVKLLPKGDGGLFIT